MWVIFWNQYQQQLRPKLYWCPSISIQTSMLWYIQRSTVSRSHSDQDLLVHFHILSTFYADVSYSFQPVLITIQSRCADVFSYPTQPFHLRSKNLSAANPVKIYYCNFRSDRHSRLPVAYLSRSIVALSYHTQLVSPSIIKWSRSDTLSVPLPRKFKGISACRDFKIVKQLHFDKR